MTEQTKDLTIVQLEVRNVTNIKALRITPDKKVIVLTGKNESGKTNVLNIVQSFMDGLKLKMPIRKGEDRGDATIDFGEFKARKRWTAKGEGLEVWKDLPDGKKQTYSSPRTFLNELSGTMVDPMNLYTLMKDDSKKFRDTLAKLVGLDLTDLKNEEQGVRDVRKLINDKIRDALAQLKEMTAPDPETPNEEKSFKEKLDGVNRLREKKATFEFATETKEEYQNDLRKNHERIKELQDEVILLEEKNTGIRTKMDAVEIPEQITPEQISAAEAEVEKLEETNVEIREAIRYRRKVKESQKFQKDSDEQTQKIERIQQDIQSRIASCSFPVEGLSLSEDTVLYEGKPIDVASSGRQIRIFTKIAVAMSPRIKVILIRDGSFLDSEGFKEVCQVAEESGYLIFFEKVDESGDVGVYIEDGEIKAVDGKPAEVPEEDSVKV